MINKINLKKLSPIQLLRKHLEIMETLKDKGVIRTRNSPVSDYAEWLVSKKLKVSLTGNSTQGVDAIGKRGKRYQVKSRHLISSCSSRQLGVIRDLKKKQFDVLIAVLFDRNYTVKHAYSIPHRIIAEHARYSKHQNGHILIIRGDITSDKRVKNITDYLR